MRREEKAIAATEELACAGAIKLDAPRDEPHLETVLFSFSLSLFLSASIATSAGGRQHASLLSCTGSGEAYLAHFFCFLFFVPSRVPYLLFFSPSDVIGLFTQRRIMPLSVL